MSKETNKTVKSDVLRVLSLLFLLAITLVGTSIIMKEIDRLDNVNGNATVTEKVSPHAIVHEDVDIPNNTNEILGETVSPMPSTTKNSKPWGVIDGWTVTSIKNFITKTGVKPNYVVRFVHWGNENQFPKDMADYAKRNNMTLVIFWEAMNYNWSMSQNNGTYSYDNILKGKFDKYITAFAAECNKYNANVIIIPFEEVNGNWYSWSGSMYSNSPAKFKQSFAYLKTKFKAAPKVKFGWAINSNSVPETSRNSIEQYYPGDENVDIVGIDGFNFGDPWVTYDEIFNAPLAKLEKYNKPIMLFSVSTMEGASKASWVRNAITKINQRNTITGWIWFNERKERNWSVWSDTQTLSTFKQLMVR